MHGQQLGYYNHQGVEVDGPTVLGHVVRAKDTIQVLKNPFQEAATCAIAGVVNVEVDALLQAIPSTCLRCSEVDDLLWRDQNTLMLTYRAVMPMSS
jgi:hypothetical protein